MGVTINLFNCTPFRLDIKVATRQKNWLQQLSNNPNFNRIVRIENFREKYAELTITMKDDNERTIKEVSFYTYYNYSWIISDTEVRRQAHGQSLYIAYQYSDSEKEAVYRSIGDYKWKKCNAIQQYDWVQKSTNICLYSGGDVCTNITQLCFASELTRCAYRSRTDDSKSNLSKTINIFNDSPYSLDIQLEAPNSNKSYWSDPANNRIVKIRVADKYPFIAITAVDSIGQKLKQASFYTWNNYSWIITDECIVRQKYGAALYVADKYEGAEEDRFSHNSDYKWVNCNNSKRYNWVSDLKDLSLFSTDLLDFNIERQKDVVTSFFIDAVNSSSLNKMSAAEKIVADLLVEWITLKNLYRYPCPSTVITANDPEIYSLAQFWQKTLTILSRIKNQSSFRIDFRRSQSDVPYDLFVIQYKNCQFATVYLRQHLNQEMLPTNRLRQAFLRSLNERIEIWVDVDNNPRAIPPSSPSDTNERTVYKPLVSYNVSNGTLRLWGRRK